MASLPEKITIAHARTDRTMQAPLVLAAVLAVAAAAAAEETLLLLHAVDSSDDAHAVCNDGSQPCVLSLAET